MAQPEFGITQFVRGMAWHDLGKPFALGTMRHAPLGYWILRLAGYDREALVALAHGHSSSKDTLTRYFRAGGSSLPGILSLCNSLDRLAASTYSMQSKGLKTDCHSMQNPFSRLPIPISGLLSRFVIPYAKLQILEKYLWRSLRTLPAEWQAALTQDTKEGVEASQQPLSAPASLPAGKDTLKVIQRHMANYPERTYPSVNDTSLAQHCRLSGILAFVVYCNLEHAGATLLQKHITYVNRDVQFPVRDFAGVVRGHLDTHLVRVAFEGHRALYEGAVRVDDLYGTRELTDLTREAFKQALAAELSVPDLAGFLTISESQFDLFFLLPPAEEPLERVIHNAYQAAIGRVTGQVADRLERDFPQISGLRPQLRQQLSDIGYGLRIVPVEVPEEADFNQFAARYGNNLLQAYGDSQKYVTFSPANLPDEANWRDDAEALPAAEICDVCSNYPVLPPPDDLNDEDRQEWQRRRDYAAHIFRGEREQVCLSCVARRTLAHGKIAKQMDSIVHSMLEPAGPGRWRSMPPPDGPDLPPLLTSTIRLPHDDEMADANAFYARYQRTQDGVDRSALEIFPTTSYAADATGNVVLLALQPTEKALIECYAYDEALKDRIQQAIGETLPDGKLWQETFVSFYKKVEGDPKTAHLAESIRHVQPHLARVMERIQHIRAFYEDLYHHLAEVPFQGFSRLRILPLDIDFPTLRLLLPADQLDKALQTLDRVMTESLFSATYPEDLARRKQSHQLLELLVPDLLHGAVVLFKHKFPLYLALEAERTLFHHLAMTDERKESTGRPSHSDWYGLRLAFTDLRGTLSQAGPILAEATYTDMGTVLELARQADRRTVLVQGETAQYISPELARALTMIRTTRTILTPSQAKELNRKEIFPPVLFLKQAIRR
jgi:hypothetical protein